MSKIIPSYFWLANVCMFSGSCLGYVWAPKHFVALSSDSASVHKHFVWYIYIYILGFCLQCIRISSANLSITYHILKCPERRLFPDILLLIVQLSHFKMSKRHLFARPPHVRSSDLAPCSARTRAPPLVGRSVLQCTPCPPIQTVRAN